MFSLKFIIRSDEVALLFFHAGKMIKQGIRCKYKRFCRNISDVHFVPCQILQRESNLAMKSWLDSLIEDVFDEIFIDLDIRNVHDINPLRHDSFPELVYKFLLRNFGLFKSVDFKKEFRSLCFEQKISLIAVDLIGAVENMLIHSYNALIFSYFLSEKFGFRELCHFLFLRSKIEAWKVRNEYSGSIMLYDTMLTREACLEVIKNVPDLASGTGTHVVNRCFAASQEVVDAMFFLFVATNACSEIRRLGFLVDEYKSNISIIVEEEELKKPIVKPDLNYYRKLALDTSSDSKLTPETQENSIHISHESQKTKDKFTSSRPGLVEESLLEEDDISELLVSPKKNEKTGSGDHPRSYEDVTSFSEIPIPKKTAPLPPHFQPLKKRTSQDFASYKQEENVDFENLAGSIIVDSDHNREEKQIELYDNENLTWRTSTEVSKQISFALRETVARVIANEMRTIMNNYKLQRLNFPYEVLESFEKEVMLMLKDKVWKIVLFIAGIKRGRVYLPEIIYSKSVLPETSFVNDLRYRFRCIVQEAFSRNDVDFTVKRMMRYYIEYILQTYEVQKEVQPLMTLLLTYAKLRIVS